MQCHVNAYLTCRCPVQPSLSVVLYGLACLLHVLSLGLEGFVIGFIQLLRHRSSLQRLNIHLMNGQCDDRHFLVYRDDRLLRNTRRPHHSVCQCQITHR